MALCFSLCQAQVYSPPIIDYDWRTQPVSNYTNFSRGWVDGTVVDKRVVFSDSESLAPTSGYLGPGFYGAASVKVEGTTNGSTPAGVTAAVARVDNHADGDELSFRVNADNLSSGGEYSMHVSALYLFRSEGAFSVGDTSLRYVNGNKSNGSWMRWVLRGSHGTLFVSDILMALGGANQEKLSNSLTTRKWAVLDPTRQDLASGIGNFDIPKNIGLDFEQITGAGVLILQNSTHKDSGSGLFFGTVREFQAFPRDVERDHSILNCFYFGNSLTASTYPGGHAQLGDSVDKQWSNIAKLGPGWQLWQHRYSVYVDAGVDGANGNYTLDPSLLGDSEGMVRSFLTEPWEAIVLQAFGNVPWSDFVTERWDYTFPEATDVGDPQSADDLIAAYISNNPGGNVFVYTNWHGMSNGVIPPYSEWTLPEYKWTETFKDADELVPGELSGEFPDRDSFDYDEQFFRFYQYEDPPTGGNNRNWTRDYHNQLFEELIYRYPKLWEEGRLSAIPLGEMFRRLDRIYQAGGDPELGNGAVSEKITRIADFYADTLHVRGGLAQFACAAAFYAALFDEHPGALDWSIYNDPANWGDDPTHDATPLLLITEARAAQVCDVVWDVLTSHPHARQRIAPFQKVDVTASSMASVWGSNSHGQIGREELINSQSNPVALEDDIVVIPGGNYAFALNQKGKVKCFGQNDRGQLGDATCVDRFFPYEVTLLPPALRIACGTHHAAAVTDQGQVWAWGSNNDGQLGDDFGRFGHTMNGFPVPPQNPRPRPVEGISDAIQIACGNGFTLALLSDGKVLSWGRDCFGQLGDGSPDATGDSEPRMVSGLNSITWIGACGDFALARRSNGIVYAWGRNDQGQLGMGDLTDRATPTQISSLSGIQQVAIGEKHVLAVDGAGSVYAWGNNANGQLGLNPASVFKQTSPVVISIGAAVSKVAAGRAHSLALTAGGDVYAWGANNRGQLGIGSFSQHWSPQWVSSLGNVASIAAAGDQSSAKIAGSPTANQPPSIATGPSASPGTVILPGDTSLSVSATDADDDSLTYTWSVQTAPGGGTVDFTPDASAQNPTASFSLAGSYLLSVSVSDGQGGTDMATVSVTVVDDDPGSGGNLSLNRTARWGNHSKTWSNGFDASVIVDGDTGTSSGTWSGINHEYQWFAVDLGTPQSITQIKMLWGGNNHQAVDYEIQVSSGGSSWNTIEQITSNNAQETTDALTATTQFVRIKVNEGGQAPSNSTRVILHELEIYGSGGTPSNTPPAIATVPSASPGTVILPGDTSLSVSATDADDDSLTYTWSVQSAPGGGTVDFTPDASAQNPTASFSLAGSYLLSVSVSDGQGGTDTATVSVTVVDDDPGSGGNLSLNRTARWGNHSKTWSNGFDASVIVDGDTGTSSGTWSGINHEYQWFAVDLGTPQSITQIKMLWGGNNHQAVDYEIQVSSDGSSWNTIEQITSNNAQETADALTATTQFVRIKVNEGGQAPSNSTRVILHELEIYGSGGGGGATLQPTDDHNTTLGDGTSDTTSAVSQWTRFAMKFDLGSVGQVDSATLRLYRRDSDTAANTVEVYAGRTDAWNESSPNADIPIETGGVLDAVNSESGGQWLVFDVTSLVAAEAAGDGTVTLVLRTQDRNWSTFVHTRQNPTNPPELVINGGG